MIFAVSLIAFGTFNAFLMILSLGLIPLKELPELRAVVPNGTISLPAFWISSYLNLLIYIAWVIGGIGALHLKEWARQFIRIAMAAYLINMIVNICLNVFLAEEVMAKVSVGFLVAGILISFSYYLGVIYFFSHPDIVRQFKFKSREY